MENNWYNIFNSSTRKGSLSCPNCNYIYSEKIVYFFDPHDCPKCKTLIGFINVSPYEKNVYVIDINKAPELFGVIFNYLSKKNHKEGYEQMKTLIQLFKKD